MERDAAAWESWEAKKDIALPHSHSQILEPSTGPDKIHSRKSLLI